MSGQCEAASEIKPPSAGTTAAFYKDVFYTGAAQVFAFAVGLVSSVVLARSLGPSGRGILDLVLLVPGVLGLLCGFSLASGVTFHIAKYPEKVRELIGAALLMNTVLACVQLAATVLFVMLFGRSFLRGVPPRFLYLAAALAFVQQLLTGPFPAVLTGMQRFGFLAVLSTISTTLTALVYVLLAYKSWLTIPAVVIANFFVAILIGIITDWATLRATGLPSLNDTRSCVSSLFKFSGLCHTSNVVTFLNYRLDSFLVNFFCGTGQTGLYACAVAVSEKLWMLPTLTSRVIFPYVAAGGARGGDKATVTWTSFLINVALASAGGAVIWALAPPIVNLLYGPQFAPAAEGIRLLLPGIVALSGGKILANDLAGQGKPGYNTIIALLTLVVTVTLDLVLIPHYGLLGAAVTTSVAYTVQLTLVLYAHKHESASSTLEILRDIKRALSNWRMR